MLESMIKNEELTYQKLSQEEMSQKGILGRLVGICADFINPTRNGRRYSEELWEKVFANPIMKEKLDSHVVFGELGHPVDRQEIDMEKVAVSLAEKPKKGSDGKLRAVFDILDTPNGRILKTLCDYGSKLGVSSRGSGDTMTDNDGNESVDPDTYDCECFDIVLVPAVKEARLSYVTEALDNKRYNKTLKQKLIEELNSASAEDKKIMNESLNDLGISGLLDLPKGIDPVEYEEDHIDMQNEELSNVSDDEENFYQDEINDIRARLSNLSKGLEEDGLTELADQIRLALNQLTSEEFSDVLVENETADDSCSDIEEKDDNAVGNAKADMLSDLQEALKKNSDLENKIINLNEKLSVCYAKETKQQEDIAKYKKAISRLSEKASRVEALQEKVSKLDTEKQQLNERLVESKNKVQKLDENFTRGRNETSRLIENLRTKDKQISSLKESLSKSNQEKESLNQQVAELKKDLSLKKSEYSSKIQKANTVVENYKKIANKAVDTYIEKEAVKLGVNVNEIKSKLPQSYTFADIDSICEELQDYRMSINNLPFQRELRENIRMKINPSKNENILPALSKDDEVDQDLLNLAGLKN